jgi:hypothetical protein
MLFLPLRSGGRCRLRRQDAEANGEAGPKGVSQERHVTRMGALLRGVDDKFQTV